MNAALVCLCYEWVFVQPRIDRRPVDLVEEL